AVAQLKVAALGTANQRDAERLDGVSLAGLALLEQRVALPLEILQQAVVGLPGQRVLEGAPGRLAGLVDKRRGKAADLPDGLRLLAAIVAKVAQHGGEAILEVLLFGRHRRLRFIAVTQPESCGNASP